MENINKIVRKAKPRHGIALAIILILVIGLAGMADTKPDEESFTGSTKDSNVTGIATAYAWLTDSLGGYIWKSSDETHDIPQSLVDPDTGAEAGNLQMGVSWTATGENIDWSTMQVKGHLVFKEYSGNGGGVIIAQTLDDVTVSELAEGRIDFAPASLMELMPESISIRDEFGIVTYPQQTEESHTCSFKFFARYTVSVFDDYGHEYTSNYDQWVTITVLWEGSDFNIEWSDPGVTATNTMPTILQLSDTSVKNGDYCSFTWPTDDGDGDFDRFEVTVDGVVVKSGAWQGGDLVYGAKWSTDGRYEIICTVYDTAGNTASDTVKLQVYTEIDGATPDASNDEEIGATSDFDKVTDDGTELMSLFGNGSSNMVIFVALAIAAVFVATRDDSFFKSIRSRF